MSHVSYFKDTRCLYMENFAILPKHPYEEQRICKKCAMREHGSRNKQKLEDIINERTEKWLKKETSCSGKSTTT